MILTRRKFLVSAGASILAPSALAIDRRRRSTSLADPIRSMSGLTLWMDAAVGCTQEASGSVDVWIDRAQGAKFVQATAGSRPIHSTTAVSGLPANTSDGTGRFMTCAGLPTFDNYTLFGVLRNNGPTSWFTKGTSSTVIEMASFMGSNSIYQYSSHNSAGIPHGTQPTLDAVTNSATISGTPYYLLTQTKYGCHCHSWLNGGAAKVPASGGNATTIGALNAITTVMGSYGAAGPTNMGLAEMLLWNRRLSASELSIVHEILRSKYGGLGSAITAPTDRKAIYFVGDSITAGIGVVTSSNKFYRKVVDVNLGRSVWDYAPLGVPYIMAQEWVDRIKTAVLPYLGSSEIVVLFAGTNDIYYSRTAQNIEDDITSICTQVKNQGYGTKIVLVTILNRANWAEGGGSATGADTGIQKTVNDWMRAGSALWDGVADAQAVANLQDTGNTTYYQSGGVHPTDTGNAELATVITSAINAL